MQTSNRSKLFRFLFILTSCLFGCGWNARLAPLPNTFLEDVNLKSKLDNLPYSHSWVIAGFDGTKINNLYIKPIRTDLLPMDHWEVNLSSAITSKEEYVSEVKAIASYFHEELVKRISEHKDGHVKIVGSPGANAAILEIALTEVEFSHPMTRAAALMAPIPGAGAAVSSMSDPHAAFAARLRDSSGKLVATAADRKFPPARLVDFNKLTASSPVREVCALWAETLAESINAGKFSKVSDNGRFSILPW